LYIASGLQRLAAKERWGILQGLLTHGEDAKDHNLPLMYWYAAEPLAELDEERALSLAAGAKVPQLLPFMAPRVSAGGPAKATDVVVAALAKADTDSARLTYLRGLQEGLKGQRNVKAPAGWAKVASPLLASENEEVSNRAVAVGVLFGDKAAFA